MDTATRATAIRDLVAAELVGTAVVVEDVRIQPAGRRRLVRVTVARDVAELLERDDVDPVAPLSLDEVALASRTVADALDAEDLMGAAPYTLEVSSAGVDQPLVTPAQFRRNVGRLLSLGYSDGGSDQGRLLAATPQGLRLSTDPGQLVPYERVRRARVEIEFNRPDPGEDN